MWRCAEFSNQTVTLFGAFKGSILFGKMEPDPNAQ